MVAQLTALLHASIIWETAKEVKVCGQQAEWCGMASDIHDGNFADEFQRLLEKTDVSCYQISQFTDIDQGYLSRLRSGEKANPSRETAFAISYALAHFGSNIDLGDVKKLLHSAGFFVPLKQ